MDLYTIVLNIGDFMKIEVYSGLLQNNGLYERFVVYKDVDDRGNPCFYEVWEAFDGNELYIGSVGYDQLPSVAKDL